MAKTIEPYEEDDFLLEEQNSTEEPIPEEEDGEDESTFKIRTARPPRASLTHNAIKSEILKMNKQQSRQADSGDDNDENLSRSARKRKKRREKVLEERRASGGRGDNFEDDLAHFKSIPISRRRSSVLPLQNISINPNYNNEEGFCSKLKCCLWILLVIGTLIGLIYVWPTVAELELADQAVNENENNENLIQPEQSINNNDIDDAGGQIINEINKLSEELGNDEDNQVEDNNQNENNEEEGLSTFDYISSFFAITDDPAEQTAENDANNDDAQNDNDNENNNENNNGEIDQANEADEQNIEPTIDENNENDEGFEEAVTADSDNDEDNDEEQIQNVESNLADQIPERYQAVHQDNQDDENDDDSCIIGGQLYNNLDEEQCKVLQDRQRQLEQQLREQEQLIRQEQDANNQQEEQFYFF